MGSPIYGIFSPPGGEDSYVLFTHTLIGQLLSVAGNRLTAGLKLRNANAGNKLQLKSREKSMVGESNGKSPLIQVLRTYISDGSFTKGIIFIPHVTLCMDKQVPSTI